MRLKDKVILITASTRGIGLACVKACAKEGAICYMGARNLEAAEKIATELNEKGFNVKYVYNDASKPESFIRMIEEVIEKEGHLDVLVNNFGTSNPKKDLDLAHTDIADYLDIITLNLRSVFLASQAAAKYMLRARYGRIISISSIVGLHGNAGQTNYAASKAGIIGMTKSLAKELASRSITVNAVAPGMIDTQMTEAMSGMAQSVMKAQIPAGYAGRPEDVAAAVHFLALPQAGYITGQVLGVDGGMGA